MKNLFLISRAKVITLFLINLICLSVVANAQYSIVVNGPSDICGVNNTSLSISPLPTGLTVKWYKNNSAPPNMPFFTGPVLSTPESGIWTAEVVVSTTPVIQSIITPSVTIRTNSIYIETPLGTGNGSCSPITLIENASYLVFLPLYDFYQWKKNGVSIPGANTYTYSASTTGVYTCTASLSCGTGTSNPRSITIENPPTQKTLSASGALTFCQGGSVTLSLTPTAGLTYQWQKNNVDIPGATSTSYLATQSGTYKCKEISTYCGSISSTSKIVTVNPLPTASFISAAGATTICAGSSVLLSGNLTGGTWSTGSSATTLTVSTSGDYYVTNINACGSVSSNHIIVTVNPMPSAAIISATGPTSFCSGGSVIIAGNAFGGSWNVGGTSPNLTVTTSGDYYVTTTNSCGSVNSNHVLVTVTPSPIPAVISASGPTTFCAGGSVTLSGNTTGGEWSMAAVTSPSIVVNLISGDYYVTNTTLCGTVSSNHIFVTVNPQPTVTIGGLAGSYNCMDAPVTLTGNPAGGTFSGLGMTGNTFNPNVVGTGGATSVDYSYSAAPNCSASIQTPVMVTSNYNCVIPQNLSVSQIAKKTAVISWNGSAAPSFKIRYRKTGTTNYLYKNITWTPCNATSVQLTGLISNTSYTVDVKTVCTSGTNTYSSPITFRTLLTNPVAPTLSSRLMDDENSTEMEESNVLAFPNPFENSLEIKLSHLSSEAIIHVTDLAGRVVYQRVLDETSISINTSEWPKGLYFLRLNNQIFKLAKQ
jgi:Secretion system C-terminal sorting domain/Fibronectin type III domain